MWKEEEKNGLKYHQQNQKKHHSGSSSSTAMQKQFFGLLLFLWLVSVINFDTCSGSGPPPPSPPRLHTNSDKVTMVRKVVHRRQIYFPDESLLSPLSRAATTRPADQSCRGTSAMLFHLETQKCYQVGSHGPCKNNLRFFPSKIRKGFGECDCALPTPTSDRGYVPMIYHPRTEKCYFIYQQAYCRRYQFLIFTSTNRLGCRQNMCLKLRMKNAVVFKGQCVELGSECSTSNHHHNSSSSNNKTKKFIGFKVGDVAARCDVFPHSSDSNDNASSSSPASEIATRTLSISNRLGCGKGFILDSEGECQEIIAFE